MKIRKLKLSSMVSNILVFSGLFQLAVISLHVKMIINLYSQIVGVYLFVFVLLTIMNILNGSNFTGKKSVINIVAIYFVTLLQLVFGVLFTLVAINEVYWIPEVIMDQTMIFSISAIGVSIVASIAAAVTATVFHFKATEIDHYLA